MSRLSELARETPVVVTGIGAFSAAGETLKELWRAALAGKSTACALNAGESSSFPVCVAPEVDFEDESVARLRRLDRCVHTGSLAAQEALLHAKVAQAFAAERVGVIVGTARGPRGNIHAALGSVPRPSTVADNSLTSLSGALARSFGFRGPSVTLAASCASAAAAIAHGAEQILLGKVDAAVVGGTEAPLQVEALRQFEAAGVLAQHVDPAQACRPFDVTRNGLVLGEGSAFLILESFDSARARGARPLARLSGWSYACEASSRTASAGAGLVHVAEEALRLAQLAPGDIDHINLHGTGTQQGDFAEAEAVAHIFRERPDVPCSSTKPITGHCLGATPALEAVISIMALREQMIPPNANCPNQDPCCRIHLQKDAPRRATLRNVMSNSLGFWGQYASLIFSAHT